MGRKSQVLFLQLSPCHGHVGLETLGSEESSLVPAVVPVSWTCWLRDPWKRRIQTCSCSCPRTSSWIYRLRDPGQRESSLVPAVVPAPFHGHVGLETLGSSSEESSLVPAVVPVPLHGQVGLETLGSSSEESSLVPAVLDELAPGLVG
jgi:hypothetical protein